MNHISVRRKNLVDGLYQCHRLRQFILRDRQRNDHLDLYTAHNEVLKMHIPAFVIFLYILQLWADEGSAFVRPDFGVYLQSFTWEDIADTYENDKLYDELLDFVPTFEDNFDGVWLPPSTESADYAGYMPTKLYGIKNSLKLKALTSAIRSKGIIAIADIVLNHRSGAAVDNCTKQYTIFEDPNWGNWAVVQGDQICNSNEVTCPSHCDCAPHYDSGDDFCATADIDVAHPIVQRDMLEWITWLQKEYLFNGLRFDMVKGFRPEFVKKYIEALNPTFYIGEYWDDFVQPIQNWVHVSGSRAFDFPLRLALNKTIATNNYTDLKQGNRLPGLMGVKKLMSVTFLDNHDTPHYGGAFCNDDLNKIIQGYVYLMTHPGAPMVSYRHWKSPEMRKILSSFIALRKRHKISSISRVHVEEHRHGLYAAYIFDAPNANDCAKGKLAVKLGTDSWTPSGEMWKPVYNGDNWTVWESSM